MRKYVITIFFLTASSGFSQTLNWTDITMEELSDKFIQTNQWYTQNTTYSFDITYDSYENYTTSVPVEEKKGVFVKKDESFFSILMGIVTIQNDQQKITVDSANKYITVNGADKSISQAVNVNEYLNYLKFSERMSKKDMGNTTIYRVDLGRAAQIKAYELTIDNEGYVVRIVYYYVLPTNGSTPAEKSKPRLEISFSNINLKPNVNNIDFSGRNYITSDGQKISAASGYQSYKIIDNRIKK
jgi:hypothetical protein